MKTEFKKTIPTYTAPKGRFEVVEVPAMQFLMIDGHGDPNTDGPFGDALEALFPMAYWLKFFSKKELDRDYTVMPLEGLWWADEMNTFTAMRDKSRWDWTAMIMTPDWITTEHIEAARKAVAAKSDPTALPLVRLETLGEGTAVQTLHVGTFDSEAPVLDTLHHDFIPARGLTMTGKHHEIYLSDMRRTAPERLRTILRQPVAPA